MDNQRYKIVRKKLYTMVVLFDVKSDGVLEKFQADITTFLENPTNIIINCCCLGEISDPWIAYFIELKNNLCVSKKNLMLIFTLNIQKKLFLYKKSTKASDENFVEIAPNLLYAIEMFIKYNEFAN
ncbi:MAG: hypothetical protein HQK49_00410 [Oligoflexia bacterium]|nr:hypothetical protein [Oligoflexia bacterium]